jgi:phage terminase large subunit-like protein
MGLYRNVLNSFDKLLELYEQELMIYGGLLVCYDTSFIAKDSKKVSYIQKWDNHSGNTDAGEYIVGHHWGILGLVCRLNKR